MRKFITISFITILFGCCEVIAQEKQTTAEVDIKSYALYEQKDWAGLLAYGKSAIKTGVDFTYLRLRIAYASFMLEKYSEAIKHYNVVLKDDSNNETARYFTWLCRIYLNQDEIASAQISFFSEKLKSYINYKQNKVIGAGFESSYKSTNDTSRGNAFYFRTNLTNRIGARFNIALSAGYFGQTINEPAFASVENNTAIKIQVPEYHLKLMYNINGKWQLKSAYHYLNTAFNNYKYNNHIGLIGFVYYGAYAQLQVDANFGKLTDSSLQQYNFRLTVNPAGNMKLYFISIASVQSGSESAFVYKQVLGAKILKTAWLEGYANFGASRNLLENDILYVFNAVDRTLFKGGTTAYIGIKKNIYLQVGFQFEKREKYQSTNTFNQHSITGGLKWKL